MLMNAVKAWTTAHRFAPTLMEVFNARATLAITYLLTEKLAWVRYWTHLGANVNQFV